MQNWKPLQMRERVLKIEIIYLLFVVSTLFTTVDRVFNLSATFACKDDDKIKWLQQQPERDNLR